MVRQVVFSRNRRAYIVVVFDIRQGEVSELLDASAKSICTSDNVLPEAAASSLCAFETVEDALRKKRIPRLRVC